MFLNFSSSFWCKPNVWGIKKYNSFSFITHKGWYKDQGLDNIGDLVHTKFWKHLEIDLG